MGLTVTQQTLCSLLAENLFNKTCAYNESTPWLDVFNESRAQSVQLLAFQNFEALPILSDIKDTINTKLSNKTFQNLRIINHHKYLHKLMCKANISYCVLKGVASAHYYDDPLIRGMGDVDFYVGQEDIPRVRDILVQDGFDILDEKNSHHIVFSKGPMHFELHFKMSGIPDGENGKRVEAQLEKLLKEKQYISDEIVEFYAPSAFHHGLIMLLHLQGHLLHVGFGLRHLCDWAVLVNSIKGEEFCDIFQKRLEQIGLWKFAQTLSLASALYIGLDRKEWMGEDDALADELIADIFAGGNFGKKSKQRAYEGLMISDHGKNGIKQSRMHQFFNSINSIVRMRWPIVEKIPLLYIPGWFYTCFRYFIRVLFRKREMVDPVKAYKNSGNRKRLYDKLQLFEREN